MHTWGAGIFDNELAVRIRAEFESALQQGHSAYAAAERIRKEYAEDHSAVACLALAALQLEHDAVHPRIKKQALTLIVTGEAAEPWEDASPEQFEARQQALQDLRRKLLALE